MEIKLPADLTLQVEDEVASGRSQSSDQLIEEALRVFLNERQRAQLQPANPVVDEAELYERVLIRGQE